MLLKHTGTLPVNFYVECKEMWILKGGKVLKASRIKKGDSEDVPTQVHADVWGDEAWDIHERGYYNDKEGIITGHSTTKKSLHSKLEKAFENAMYIR